MSILIIKSGTTSISGGTVKGNFTYFSATTKGLGGTIDTGFWSGVDPTCDGYTVYKIGGQHGWAAMVATGREQLNYYLQLFGGTGTTTDENVTWATNSNNIFIHTGSTGPCPTPTINVTPTPTPTNGTTPTPTPTPTSTPAGIQATIAFSFFDNGSGVVSARMEVTNGVTLDSLSWGGTGIGYSALGCSGTENTQSFNDVLGIGATQISTEVWGSISAILSAQNQTSSFSVNGNTINTVSQIITVGGHNYLINAVTNCFSPLTA
jgi:hypothetical protein